MSSFEPDVRYQEPTVQERLAAVQDDTKLERIRDQIVTAIRQDKDEENEVRMRFELVKLVLENDPEPLTSKEVITEVEALYQYVTVGLIPIAT